MLQICPTELCTGCMACMNACAHDAIQIAYDSVGFKYPLINQDVCIECGACKKVCPSNYIQKKKKIKACYAVTAKNNVEILFSASGGALTALSRYVMQCGGIVYGCSGKEIKHVKHTRVLTKEDLLSLRGSKYVQSDIGLIYREVKEDLCRGGLVLFIGTPCQIAGLKGYLRKDYDNLITADIVCHGVPSQSILNDNINLYQKRFKDMLDINTIHFREKLSYMDSAIGKRFPKIEYGFYFSLKDSNGEEIRNKYPNDAYIAGFIKGLFLRKSCYQCLYACADRVSDFTFADFWGIRNDVKISIDKGVSAVLLNTEKAESLFEKLKKYICYERRDIQEAINGNGRLQSPTIRHANHDLFYRLYPSIGLKKSVRICLFKNWLGYKKRTFIEAIEHLKSFMKKSPISR